MANHEFKWKHFAPEIILWCLRWYVSYANISGMLAERGISVDRSLPSIVGLLNIPHHYVRNYVTINSSIQTSSWQLDETYVKVKG